MEEVIQILVFVIAMVIAVVSQSAKNKKKSTTSSPEDVLEDVFPDIEVTKDSTEVISPQPIRPKKAASKRTSRQAKPAPRTVVDSSNPLPPSGKPVQKVRISTREEARRAFIHSEIFNRKY